MTVQDGGVVAWKARRVAAATRALTSAQVAEVDTAVYDVIATLGWSRFEAILDATVKQADPEGARAAEQLAATQRFVAIGRANDHHIRTLIARGTSLDILSFMAAVNRIAELLGDEGDPDPIDIRRSKAIGILARPAHALELLARHQTPRTSEAAQDGEPDPEGDGHLSSPPHSSLRDDGHRCGCAPRIRLHVHLTDVALRGTDPRAVCRVDGVGPVTAQMVRDWLGRSDIAVTVQPVVLPDPPPVDGYEIRKQSATPWPPATPSAFTRGRRVLDRPSTWTTPPPTYPWRRAARPVRLVSTRWVRWPEGSTGTRRSATSKSGSQSRASTSGAAATAGSGWSPTPAPTLSAEAQEQTPSGKPPHRWPKRHPDRPRLVIGPEGRCATGSTWSTPAPRPSSSCAREHRRYREGMRWTRTITVVDCHAEGESGQVVVGGGAPDPGETVFEKRMFLQDQSDDLRRMILFEPRGAPHHNANILVPSNHPDAQMGYIILESTEYPAMSGSNTICVATVLLETGILPMSEPTTELTLESPAGLITVTCDCRDGKVERVRFVNQPAFCYYLDAEIEVPDVGRLTVDVAYGGMTYVLVEAARVAIRPNAR